MRSLDSGRFRTNLAYRRRCRLAGLPGAVKQCKQVDTLQNRRQDKSDQTALRCKTHAKMSIMETWGHTLGEEFGPSTSAMSSISVTVATSNYSHYCSFAHIESLHSSQEHESDNTRTRIHVSIVTCSCSMAKDKKGEARRLAHSHARWGAGVLGLRAPNLTLSWGPFEIYRTSHASILNAFKNQSGCIPTTHGSSENQMSSGSQ